METEAAKLIAAALALLPILGVGIGLGNTFGSYFDAVGRNPEVGKQIEIKYWLSFAFIEALGIFALLIAFIILGS